MDRTNLGIAAVAGMSVDLGLGIGARYSLITCIFFISYVLLQPPATVILRKVGPAKFLPTITVLWGMTMMCFGFLTVWTQMMPLRVVLGIFEAGFFPGNNKRIPLLTPTADTKASRLCIPALVLVPSL